MEAILRTDVDSKKEEERENVSKVMMMVIVIAIVNAYCETAHMFLDSWKDHLAACNEARRCPYKVLF